MSDEILIERMRPAQIVEARRRADLAFLPLGAIEWHGVDSHPDQPPRMVLGR